MPLKICAWILKSRTWSGLPDTNLDTAVRAALRTAGHTVPNELPMSEELLESLDTLTASNRNIADLSGLEAATELTSLDLENNDITDVSPLSKLYALETLMLDRQSNLGYLGATRVGASGNYHRHHGLYRYPNWDVNQDSDVDEADVFLITATITGESPDVNGDGNVDADDRDAADVNKDNRVDTDDLLLVFEKFDRPVNLAAPLLSAESVGLDWRLLEAHRCRSAARAAQYSACRKRWFAEISTGDYVPTSGFGSDFNRIRRYCWRTTRIRSIRRRGSRISWHAVAMCGLRFMIHGVRLSRRLALGYRAEGYYRVRGRAAHWEGRNGVGERVASGIYFYQLETDDTSLLRKMVILK